MLGLLTEVILSQRKIRHNLFRGVVWRNKWDVVYSRADNFIHKAKASLKKIQLVYPSLKIESAEGGINILPSSSPSVRVNL